MAVSVVSSLVGLGALALPSFEGTQWYVNDSRRGTKPRLQFSGRHQDHEKDL